MSHTPHEVVVTPRIRTRDAGGAPVWADGTPVAVRAVVQPLTAVERVDLGLATETTRKVLTPEHWPGGLHSRITWDGRDWDQVGEARTYVTGRRSQHDEVVIKARGTEAR